MKIKSAVFEQSAPDVASCPRRLLPEFALIGRSNVGKSSLLNLLAERRDLARVSDVPGKTKLMNFFLINGAWRLVDLPGYGYAKVGKHQRADFNEATADFLARREGLRRVFVLVDSRLEPQAIDIDFVRWMESRPTPFAVVFTKMDKQSGSQGEANIARFKKRLEEWRSELPPIFRTSAKTAAGRGDLLAFIEQALAGENEA